MLMVVCALIHILILTHIPTIITNIHMIMKAMASIRNVSPFPMKAMKNHVLPMIITIAPGILLIIMAAVTTVTPLLSMNILMDMMTKASAINIVTTTILTNTITITIIILPTTTSMLVNMMIMTIIIMPTTMSIKACFIVLQKVCMLTQMRNH